MPAEAKIKSRGESGETRSPNNRHEVAYIVANATSLNEAIGAAYTAAPATIVSEDGVTLYRGGVRYDELATSPDESVGAYEITISYQVQSFVMSDAGTTRIRLSTTGGTQKVTQSKETIHVYKKTGSGDAAPDFKGAIGVTTEGVEGVDTGVSVFKFTVSKVFNLADLPSLNDLVALNWHYNDANMTFEDTVTHLTFTLLAGECLFQGCEIGDTRSDGKIEIVYTFEGSPNLTNFVIGDLDPIDKLGWHYLWVYYVPSDDGTASNKAGIQKPKFAVVDRTYDSGDLSLLGATE